MAHVNESFQYIVGGVFEAAAPDPVEAKLLKRLRETITDFDFDDYVDPRDAFYDDEGRWTALGGIDEKDGSLWPAFRTVKDLQLLRDECRGLAYSNEFAINGHENRINYIVGTGHKYQALARKEVTVPDEIIQAINKELETFCTDNKWGVRQQEILRRYDRDGEVFLRLFETRGEQGQKLAVRFVEPVQVKPVDGESRVEASFGILTDPDDVETVQGYYVDGKFIDSDEIQHRKANVDFNVKRGLPLFYPVRKNLRRAERLLRNITTTSSIQAAIALIRKHKQASGASIRTFINAQADLSISNRDTGKTTYHKQYAPGTILDASADTEYDFPAAGVNVERFVAGLQAELRAVASRLCMPEFMLTSDASNANYASTLVAEGPADKMFQREQARLEEYDRVILERVLDLASRSKRIPEEWRELVTINVHRPRVQVRNEAEEVASLSAERIAGVLSPQTWSVRRGLDYEQEQENIVEHLAKYGVKEPIPSNDGEKPRGTLGEALRTTLTMCESPVELLAAAVESLREHCGANAEGGGGFQQGNTCAKAERTVVEIQKDFAEFRRQFVKQSAPEGLTNKQRKAFDRVEYERVKALENDPQNVVQRQKLQAEMERAVHREKKETLPGWEEKPEVVRAYVGQALQSMGFKKEHESSSGSEYYLIYVDSPEGGVEPFRVRVADHAVPSTVERDYNSQQGGFSWSDDGYSLDRLTNQRDAAEWLVSVRKALKSMGWKNDNQAI